MDHCGDMIWAVQKGLESQGYRGVLEWTGKLKAGEPWPDADEASVARDHATAVMWLKDGAFRVTIETVF